MAITQSPFDLGVPKTASSYAIAAGGVFTDNSGGNFARDLNNPFDDAQIYAGGLTINGLTTVLEFGSPIAVGPGAIVADAVRQRWKVENVTLIVKDGRVNFGDVRAVNTAVFASDGYDSTVVGTIRAQGRITFNARVQVSTDVQPLIGIIDTGFNGSNPDID